MPSRPFAFALQNSFVMSDIFPGWLPISLRLIGALHPHNSQRTPKDNRKKLDLFLKSGITEAIAVLCTGDSYPQHYRFISPGVKIHWRDHWN